MHPGDWGPMPWFGMMMAPLMMMVFLAVAAVLAVALLRGLGLLAPRAHGADAARAALDILNQRFARGEIDKAEYEEKRRLIAAG